MADPSAHDNASRHRGGRPAGGKGQIRENTNRDGTVTYSVRVRWQGKRINVRLGNELEGWNRRLAEVKLAQILAEIQTGIWSPPIADIPDEDRDPTFHAFSTIWLDRQRIDLDESTTTSYQHTLSRYILPEFKDHALTDITYEAVLRWRDRLRQEAEQRQLAKQNNVTLTDRHGRPKRAFGSNTINEAVRLLGQILNRAVESEHYLLERNPVKGRSGLRLRPAVRPPREHLEADELASFIRAADLLDQGMTMRTLTRALRARSLREAGLSWAQVASDLDCAETTAIYLAGRSLNAEAPRRRRAMVIALALTGMRASELTELRWSRVDHTHGRIVVPDSKSAAGVREIHLSPFARTELELYRASLPDDPIDDDCVFKVRHGGATDRFNLGRQLKRIAQTAAQLRASEGVAPMPERITPHTFRRSFITLSLQAGQDLVFVQSQAGHADWKTTLDIYTQQSRRSIEPPIRRLLQQFLGDDADARASTLHERHTVPGVTHR